MKRILYTVVISSFCFFEHYKRLYSQMELTDCNRFTLLVIVKEFFISNSISLKYLGLI